jgi:hypothetical protein
MVEIAGGIVLAVLFLCLVPLALILAITVVKWVLIVAVALGIIYLVASEPEAVAVIAGILVVAAVFFTTFAAFIGIIISRLPYINARLADKVSLVKPASVNYKQHFTAVYDYYHPLGLKTLVVLFVAFIAFSILLVMIEGM